MVRKNWIIGNWKMHGTKHQVDAFKKQLQVFADQALLIEIGLCVPSTLIYALADKNQKPFFYPGGQDCSALDTGARTGEIAAYMLADVGAKLVIIGHSERRTHHHESEQIICDKISQALNHKLKVIICIGENIEQYNEANAYAVIKQQLISALDLGDACLEKMIKNNELIIAYEPVWAIGTGKVATTEYAQTMHGFIRQYLSEHLCKDYAQICPIIYGGSMNASNAQALLQQPDIDGGLIGGASLDGEEFFRIVNIAKDMH